MKCSEDCPCEYTPATALYDYGCIAGVIEFANLLGTKQVWNCRCQKPGIEE